MRVTVIGGTGFIGSATVNYLLKQGHTVYVHTMKAMSQVHPRCHQILGDLQNDSDISYLMKCSDTIIYLVTVTTPQSSMNAIEIPYTMDIPLLLRVLEHGYREGVRRIIYASSGGAIYGIADDARNEDAATHPLSHYGIGKLACEKILELYNHTVGMENISLRIANPFGPGQIVASHSGVLVTFIKRISQGLPIQIYGSDSIKKDYISVNYVAKAFENAMYWQMDREVLPIFNIGSGIGISLAELITLIEKSYDTSARIEYRSGREGDISNNILDISKACEVLGYIPPNDPYRDIADFINEIRRITEKNV